MNGLLLDTCTILFLSTDDPVLSSGIKDLIMRTEEIFISAITVAELACLSQKGRIDLGAHWKPWFRNAVELNGWQVLAASWEILEEAYSLPENFHADPADRILVATSRKHRIPLITSDRKILDYPHVDTFWD